MPKQEGVRFRRKSKWMRPPLVDTLKRLVREVRLEKKSLQKLALTTTFRDAKGHALKIPERTLRRYVDLSKDDARQDSGLYIPLQSYETLSKELQRKKMRGEIDQRQMQEQRMQKLQTQTNEKQKVQEQQKLKTQQQKKMQEMREREMQNRKHETQKQQKNGKQERAWDTSQTEMSPAKRARTQHPHELSSDLLPAPNMSHILPQFSPPGSSGSMKLPISSTSPWTQLTPATLRRH